VSSPLFPQRSAIGEAIRAILLENPAAIEHLPAGDGSLVDRLLEANGLEPHVCDLAARHGVESLISPRRLSGWRMARLMAVARTTVFGEALREVLELAAAREIPVRLLPATQVAFRVLSGPELRPLSSLDIQVPRGRERELQLALKTRRFFEVEDLVSVDYEDHHHLRPLERDGVTVKVHRRSASDLRYAPWDVLPDAVEDPSRPLVLDPEPLVLLLCHEMAARRFSHSLGLLRDLHAVMTTLKPDGARVVRFAIETGLSMDAFASLSILETVLGPAAGAECLRSLEDVVLLPAPRKKLLTKTGVGSLLQYPASPRLMEAVGKGLDGAKPAERVLAGAERG
jgi:hypothetical protein